MDNSPPESDRSPQELSPADLQSPERRSVRRRLVQSTLFPHNPQPKGCEENGEDVGDGDNGGGEDEDCGGSQSKKKRKAKGKTTPSKRSSEKVKGKRSVSTTPKKNLANLLSEEAPLVVPNLRLEAKLTAEENSRLYAGRQIHPFFSSCKAGKKTQEVIDLEGKHVAVSRDNKVINCGPIHVFEKTEDNDEPLDWRTWTFHEGIFMKSSFVSENTCSSIVEGSVECLSFDKFPIISQLKNTCISGDDVPANQCFIQGECAYEIVPTASDIADDEKVICYQPFQGAEDNKVNKVDSFTWHAGGVWNPDIGHENRFLDERMKSYYFGCCSQAGDSLWTDKYQPKKAMEVCGNDESVKFLTEWLQQWRERKFQINKDIDCDTGDMQDNDYICSESDSGAENKHEEAGLKNVLLVTGPVGSGKSAAVYACAREQGFDVLEVNASECRSGALVKQRFGEALKSRQLKRSLANPACSPNKHTVKPSSLVNGISTQKSDDGLADLIALTDEDCHQEIEGSGFSNCKEAGSCSSQVEVKPLILFEDADITFFEDRGFIAAVQQISETAKGPIILTSNSHNPFLPDNLDRLQICFEPPPPKDMLCHVYMICVAERANIQPCLLERLIACCEGDIRKAIMHLQFWCHGKNSRKAKKIQRTRGSVLFDTEAGHQILPKLIPWDLPSQLSELVEKEITESLSREEDSSLMEVIEEEELDQNETHCTFMHNNEKETIEAKKAAMLSRNCTINAYDEFRAQIDPVHEFSDNSDTPFSCFRRNIRKQHDTVLSSDSEDELVDNGCNICLDRDTNNEALLEGSLPFKELPCSAAADADGKPNHYAESERFMPINYDDCKSLDVSRVPESSFVPETILSNGTEVNFRKASSDCVEEEVSVSNGLTVAPDDMDISLEIQNDSDTLLGSQSVTSELCQQEEVEDSQNEHVGAVAFGYQLMDESSRMDYRRLSKYVEKPKPSAVTDLVQKSWDKLRSCRADLAQYVRSEGQHNLQITKLTHEMSNLISETDMLLSNSQLLASDSLEQSMIQSEESDAYSLYDTSLLATTTAEHGFCFYAKTIAVVGSTLGCESMVDLASEMLASTAGMMESGELVRQDFGTSRNSYSRRNLESSMEKSDTSFKSELFDILQSIVPPKSYTTLNGAAFYEYLSSLRCISRSETSRLLQNNEKPRKRRRRADRHYLSNGTLMLTPEEISSLGQIKSFRENPSQQADSV